MAVLFSATIREIHEMLEYVESPRTSFIPGSMAGRLGFAAWRHAA